MFFLCEAESCTVLHTTAVLVQTHQWLSTAAGAAQRGTCSQGTGVSQLPVIHHIAALCTYTYELHRGVAQLIVIAR